MKHAPQHDFYPIREAAETTSIKNKKKQVNQLWINEHCDKYARMQQMIFCPGIQTMNERISVNILSQLDIALRLLLRTAFCYS